VLVIGLDGLEPKIVEPLLEAGELPALAKLRARGGYSRLATTCPAQTPVAWSTFATGVNPGGHGIFDFISRDPKTYLPSLALNRYEQKNKFLPPKAVNLRRGEPLWDVLSRAGIESTVLRCPCTYPPDTPRGRLLAGMGVPDLRGGLGTPTFYTSAPDAVAGESETLVRVATPASGTITTHLAGPRNPRDGSDIVCPITVRVDAAAGKATVCSDGMPRELELQQGKWSDWLKVKFKTGFLQSARGMVRFLLVRTTPIFELYASPINFDPNAPLFPISSPPEYAGQVADQLGPFYTTGMVEDHGGLNNGRFDEAAYLQQCAIVMAERERMMLGELGLLKAGFLFCLVDTPDRLQHMFWRFREPSHPANGGAVDTRWTRVIEDHYRTCDRIVGEALRRADDQTLVIVLSDHGFNSFQRGIHLNTWLHDNGLLALKPGVAPGDEAGDFLRHVDWARTRAYALGLGSMYLNLKGREEQGIVDPADAPALQESIVKGLTGLVDPDRVQIGVQSVVTREQVYSGPCAAEAPDLVVQCAAGYRSSWETALGGVPRGHFADNHKRWSGDHIIAPNLVPGVLFMSQAFRGDGARMLDLAPTILAALGVPKGQHMEGKSLLP
jgi:predicted AlkP superfamily phosphohydrolase/phosphomutase